MELSIIAGDVNCSVAQPRNHLHALAIIRNVCRARPNGYQFMPRYRKGMWDGYISLMQGFSKFPTGLLPLVEKTLLEAGYNLTISAHIPEDAQYTIEDDCLNGITLRDYQIEAAQALLQARRGVAKMATNAGKTEVMAAIIKQLHVRTMVLVHRKELLYQTAQRFEHRLGIRVGKIGDGIQDVQGVTVAMVQTLSKRMHDIDLSDISLVMVDECHHMSSDQHMDCLQHIPGAYRFGFSGTPLKYDQLNDLKLIAATGDIVYEVTNKNLIENQYSAKPKICLCEMIDLERKSWKQKYSSAYEDLIVNNSRRNRKIAKFAKEATGTVLVLVNRLDHGEKLASMIVGSQFVHGSDTTDTRQNILDEMRSGAGGVYVASPIFDEGVDVPALDCVILAGGGKSHIKLLQRLGRGMRKKDRNNVLLVYDFVDNTNRYLYNHSLARIATYEEEEFEVQRI